MAGVALSSLRVGADFDATAYVRGAAQKVAADQQMIAADKARNAALAQADAAMAKAIPGVARLSSGLLEGYSAGAKFDAIVRSIGNSVDRGLGLDRAGVLLDAAYRKFGLTADAVALAQKGFVSLAPAIDAANQRYQTHAEQVSRVTVQTEALAAAQRSQAEINSRLGIPVNDNSASRGADIAALGVSLDTLRAKYSPLFAAQQSYLATLRDLNTLEARTALTETERAAAIARTKEAFAGQVVAIRGAARETGLATYQVTNLGYQLNDIATGLATGQSPFMIMAQQGGQVQQILASGQGGVTGSLKGIATTLVGLVTPGRTAFAVVAAGAALATTALVSYESRLQEVQRQLTGMGRASGATTVGIDTIAQANSSPSGLSTNEARNLAAALAATGKVGVESIGPIVAIGHDFAKTFGVDAKEATDILAKAFADPVRGAEELNQRLGFLDANTKLLIESLVIQGNRTEAIRILTEKTAGSIAKAADITGFWSNAATTAGNKLSDFFDQIGRGADRVFAGGSGLDEKISNLTIKLLELDKARLSGNPLDVLLQNEWPSDLPAKIAAVTAEINRLNAVRQKQSAAPSAETADKQRALEIDAIARATLPAIEVTRQLRDETAELIIAGISAERGPEAYMIKTKEAPPIGISLEEVKASGFFWPEPFKLQRIDDMTCGPVPQPAIVEAAVEFGGFEMFSVDDDPADVVAGLNAFIELQRHSLYNDGICWVGGHAELVTVSAQGINHQIVRRWADKIGEPMKPGEPDWSDKRKPAKAALRVVQ